jgi:hypothetical protein
LRAEGLGLERAELILPPSTYSISRVGPSDWSPAGKQTPRRDTCDESRVRTQGLCGLIDLWVVETPRRDTCDLSRIQGFGCGVLGFGFWV